MKRIFSIFITITLFTTLTACKNGTDNNSTSINEDESTISSPTSHNANALIVYFSHSGNTKKVAEIISANTGSDLFEIVPATPYPKDYDECVDIAQAEKSQKARPELLNKLDNLDEYEVIYLGYPCWWGTCPMIVFTFLEEYDLSNKIIIPFTTHGGSGFGSSLDDIEELCPDSTILEGFKIKDSKVDDSEDLIIKWLNQLEY